MSLSGNFYQDVTCLIVEPSRSFSSVIQCALQELGVFQGNIFFSKDFQQAKEMVLEQKPTIIVSEYEINRHFAFEVSQLQRMQMENPYDCIFFIISGNATHVAVAEAAEEDVDGYLLKPFSQGTLTERLNSIIRQKLHPGPYTQKIRDGKEHLLYNELKEAEAAFLAATDMDGKPSLAWYYAGYVSKKADKAEEAIERFRQGLKHKPLHYKCLVGQFNTLFALKRYQEAYEVAKVLSKNFPVTPSRLGHFFITAVYTYQFQDIPRYYEIYKDFEHRPQDLIRIMCAATLAGGKYFLNKADYAMADSFFQMGSTISGRSVDYLHKSIKVLLEHRQFDSAKTFYDKVDMDDANSAEHILLGFEIDRHTLSPQKIVAKGKDLIQREIANEMVYQSVVESLLTSGKILAAETIAIQAVKNFPDLREPLYTKIEEAFDKQLKESAKKNKHKSNI